MVVDKSFDQSSFGLNFFRKVIDWRTMDLASMRQEYTRGGLRRSDLKADPIEQFRVWFEQAWDAKIPEAHAFTLATASGEGRPDVRTVLLKGYDAQGFVFFTNLESLKARHIAENPFVAMLFPWLPLERQVRITGQAEKVSTAEAVKYFVSRPLGSRLGAWASAQSRVIESRKMLEMKFEEMKRKFADGEVPLPSFWGGYRIVPETIEFWQGRASRLHDRLQYARQADGSWKIERLAP